MKATELLQKCSELGFKLTFDALKLQAAYLTSPDSEVDDAFANQLLSSLSPHRASSGSSNSSSNGGNGSQRPQLRSAGSEPEPESNSKPETPSGDPTDSLIEAFVEEGRISPQALQKTADMHRISLEMVLQLAETLQLDREEIAVLRGYVWQCRELAIEELGRQMALLDHSETVRVRLDKQRSTLSSDNSNIEALQERLGIDFTAAINRAAEADAKHRSVESRLNQDFFQAISRLGQQKK